MAPLACLTGFSVRYGVTVTVTPWLRPRLIASVARTLNVSGFVVPTAGVQVITSVVALIVRPNGTGSTRL